MTKVKNRKENRKGAERSILSIVKGVIGHLSMDVHTQGTQAYIFKDNSIPLTKRKSRHASTNTHLFHPDVNYLPSPWHIRQPFTPTLYLIHTHLTLPNIAAGFVISLQLKSCTQGPMIHCCWKVAGICLTSMPTPPAICQLCLNPEQFIMMSAGYQQ